MQQDKRLELLETLHEQYITIIKNVYADMEGKLRENTVTNSKGTEFVKLNQALMSLRGSRATVIKMIRDSVNARK